MAKIVLITDTHFGVRINSEHFHDNMQMFYENVFFPYLQSHDDIDGVIHLGDVFDDRRKIDVNTASRARQYFFEPMHSWLNSLDITCHVILGNHDSFYRDSLDVNTLDEFIKNQTFLGTGRRRFQIHSSCIEIPEWDCIFVPWITKNNRYVFENKLANTKSSYLFGHLELAGFNFSKVQVANHGDDPQTLAKFKRVFSGHYHYPHSRGNISYLGSPTEHTWIDLDTKRGFYIFDTVSGELEFIENPYNIFQSVEYGEQLEDNHPRYFRLYRTGEEKQSEVDNYIKTLYQNHKAISVDVIIKNMGKDVKQTISESSESIDNIEDTPTFIRNNVEETSIADILIGLYNRAMVEA